jgi:hypothetical protein
MVVKNTFVISVVQNSNSESAAVAVGSTSTQNILFANKSSSAVKTLLKFSTVVSHPHPPHSSQVGATHAPLDIRNLLSDELSISILSSSPFPPK